MSLSQKKEELANLMQDMHLLEHGGDPTIMVEYEEMVRNLRNDIRTMGGENADKNIMAFNASESNRFDSVDLLEGYREEDLKKAASQKQKEQQKKKKSRSQQRPKRTSASSSSTGKIDDEIEKNNKKIKDLEGLFVRFKISKKSQEELQQLNSAILDLRTENAILEDQKANPINPNQKRIDELNHLLTRMHQEKQAMEVKIQSMESELHQLDPTLADVANSEDKIDGYMGDHERLHRTQTQKRDQYKALYGVTPGQGLENMSRVLPPGSKSSFFSNPSF